MAKKVTISFPDDLHERMEKWRDKFNFSRIFQDAVRRAIERKEDFQMRMKEEDPKMDEVIERLRKEREESEHHWFDEGKNEGMDFAKRAHYDDIQLVIRGKDFSGIDPELFEYDSDHWKDRLSELRSKLGGLDDERLEKDVRFHNWRAGFKWGIQEFWNEIKDKL